MEFALARDAGLVRSIFVEARKRRMESTPKFTERGWGAHKFTHPEMADKEPIDWVHATRWDTVGGDTCVVCSRVDDLTWEIRTEWGDTELYEYFSEVCWSCATYLKAHVRNSAAVKTRFE